MTHRVTHPLEGVTGIPLFFRGPPLARGPLPAFFYFALAGDESLDLSPINQPANEMDGSPVRVFSLTLPSHGRDFNSANAVGHWLERLSAGDDIITPFLEAAGLEIHNLIDNKIVDPDHIAVGGLSRGAFIALHIAARNPFIKTIVGFSPLTQLTYFRTQFDASHPLVDALNINHLREKLYNRSIRFYIGNRDILVGTDACFQLVTSLVETAFHHKIRSSQLEMIIYPSIGHKGHGTPPEVFAAGSLWVKTMLGVAS